MTMTSLLFDPSTVSSSTELGLLRGKIGNKALGLVRLKEAGFLVPQWVGLNSDFFAPWLLEIEAKFPFAEVVTKSPLDPDSRTDLDSALRKLQVSDAQSKTLLRVLSLLGESNSGFAVRSSSQYEDMKAHSFAGIYDSILGVRGGELLNAITECFASGFSDKVLTYVEKTKLEIEVPTFSMIIQHQIDCSVSGIGFSIHPINNHYDVAYLNSNFGLGESIASGATTPDTFEVNKVSMEIVATHCGEKSRRSQLDDTGFIQSIEVAPSNMLSLENDQVSNIVDQIKQIEELFGNPVEIEWGIAAGELFLFQVRPITRWVPLPSEMLTDGKQKPVLYMDRALSDGMTMNIAASHLGLDVIRGIEMSLYERYIGPINKNQPPKESLLFHTGGRIYANLSIVLCMTTASKLVETLKPLNGQLSQILGGIDLSRYALSSKPPYLRNWKVRLLPLIVWRARTIIGKIRQGMKNPAKLKESYDRDTQSFRLRLDELDRVDVPFPAYVDSVQKEIITLLAECFVPALVLVSNGATKKLDKLFPSPSEHEKLLIDTMKRGFADNVVVRMGVQMQRMGNMLHSADIEGTRDALQQLESGRLDPLFCESLDAFLLEYGHRGPNEMDVAQARYKDNLEFTLAQMLAVSGKCDSTSDECIEVQRGAGVKAYESLQEKLTRKDVKKLAKIYSIYQSFGAMRDTPKHFILLGLQKIRERSLIEGQTLYEEDRIFNPKDIFKLRLEEISNTNLDLKERAQENERFRSSQSDCVVAFPSVIDSRGYIPGNDQIPSAASDVMIGIPVSPGIVQGTVKILSGDEPQVIHSSDIVVAYVTDPALTPCFNNAAGVVLEIGGALQHGAVVARELGIPCVTSILGVSRLLKNGDHIEVNGNDGSVRMLS